MRILRDKSLKKIASNDAPPKRSRPEFVKKGDFRCPFKQFHSDRNRAHSSISEICSVHFGTVAYFQSRFSGTTSWSCGGVIQLKRLQRRQKPRIYEVFGEQAFSVSLAMTAERPWGGERVEGGWRMEVERRGLNSATKRNSRCFYGRGEETLRSKQFLRASAKLSSWEGRYFKMQSKRSLEKTDYSVVRPKAHAASQLLLLSVCKAQSVLLSVFSITNNSAWKLHPSFSIIFRENNWDRDGKHCK